MMYDKRNPHYNYDIERFGGFGEDFFLQEYKHLDIVDVRKDWMYQRMDVDFIVDKKYKVDVKLDTIAYLSGNLVFEVVAHGSAGWGVITKADYIYQVITDKQATKVLRTLMIDVNMWKDYCANRQIEKKVSYMLDENNVNILCNIDDLIAYGAVIKEKSYE